VCVCVCVRSCVCGWVGGWVDGWTGVRKFKCNDDVAQTGQALKGAGVCRVLKNRIYS